MKKLVVLLGLSASFLFAQINLQTASKEELMEIKGIGDKKVEAIKDEKKKELNNEVDKKIEKATTGLVPKL